MQDEQRLVSLQFNRNDIGQRKLSKGRNESSRSVMWNRAATEEELKIQIVFKKMEKQISLNYQRSST